MFGWAMAGPKKSRLNRCMKGTRARQRRNLACARRRRCRAADERDFDWRSTRKKPLTSNRIKLVRALQDAADARGDLGRERDDDGGRERDDSTLAVRTRRGAARPDHYRRDHSVFARWRTSYSA